MIKNGNLYTPLLIAVALHGIVLMMPVESESNLNGNTEVAMDATETNAELPAAPSVAKDKPEEKKAQTPERKTDQTRKPVKNVGKSGQTGTQTGSGSNNSGQTSSTNAEPTPNPEQPPAPNPETNNSDSDGPGLAPLDAPGSENHSAQPNEAADEAEDTPSNANRDDPATSEMAMNNVPRDEVQDIAQISRTQALFTKLFGERVARREQAAARLFSIATAVELASHQPHAYANFPIYEVALPGSVGLLQPSAEQQTFLYHTIQPLSFMVDYHRQQFKPLEAVPAIFTMSETPVITEAGYEVYRLSVADDDTDPQYLHFVRHRDYTVVLLIPQALNRQQLVAATHFDP
ncbi:MAG: hypothetical protein AAGG51_26715 [Cyanobacteria bacterium P01_G01_bin.54]